MGNNKTAQTLESLLKDFEEPNKLIKNAMNIRRENIENYLTNNGNNPKKENFSKSLLPEEKKNEFDAYKKYFKLNILENDVEGIQNNVDDKWNKLSSILKEELFFNENEYPQDLNKYHNVLFEIQSEEDWKILGAKKITTDNHSSKLFIEDSVESFFLGDLLGKQLPYSENTKSNQNNPSGSMILINEDEDQDEDKNENEYRDKDNEEGCFNFLKYNYFMLYLAILQANYRVKLLTNSLEFKELKYFYCLGNHDCGVILRQDIENLKFNSTYDFIKNVSGKIDRINRFLIPTEIVFTLKDSKEVYVFSHSGGMILLPDNTEKIVNTYSDFKINFYNYSLKNYSIKENFNKLKKIDFKYFMYKVFDSMLKSVDKDIVNNPFIWCDFFEFENDSCSYEHGRYRLSNIKESNTLECCYNILSINYNLENSIDSIEIFRGHEHAHHAIKNFFQSNPLYKLAYRIKKTDKDYDSINVNFNYLAPAFLDNLFIKIMDSLLKNKKKDLNFTHSIEECKKIKPDEILDHSNNKINKIKIEEVKIVRCFFKDESMYKLCNNLLEILHNIQNNSSRTSKNKIISFNIINLSEKLKSDQEIFFDLLMKINEFDFSILNDCHKEENNDKCLLHNQRALFILKMLHEFNNKIDNNIYYNLDINYIKEFILSIHNNISQGYNEIKTTWNEESQVVLKKTFQETMDHLSIKNNAHVAIIIQYMMPLLFIGYMMPLLFMNIEKCGLGNITTGILMSLFIYFIKIGADKKTTIVFDYLLFISLPFVCSVICLLLSNESLKNVLKHIFDYVSINAYKYNYAFFRNIILQK